MQPDKNEAIRKRAHEIWDREGRPEGRHDEHWRKAEAELAAAGDQGSEGEGNKTAALAFDRNQTDFAKSTDTARLGETAKEALEGSESATLKTAEEEARSRSRGENSALAGKSAPANGA